MAKRLLALRTWRHISSSSSSSSSSYRSYHGGHHPLLPALSSPVPGALRLDARSASSTQFVEESAMSTLAPRWITSSRVYADANVLRPREYWDYESLVLRWG